MLTFFISGLGSLASKKLLVPVFLPPHSRTTRVPRQQQKNLTFLEMMVLIWSRIWR